MNIEEQIKKLGFEKQPPLECFFTADSFIYKRDNFFLTNHDFRAHDVDDEFITAFFIGKKHRKILCISYFMFENLEFIDRELKELVNN
jgi:hypothetical protein